MSLTPARPRQSLHHRRIDAQGYRRDDGLFDIEGHLLDTKDADFKLASGVRSAGEPIHSMWLRITVDRALTIVDVEAATEAMPYVGVCDTITGDYRKLVGLRIGPGFKEALRKALGGAKGCTHLTELVNTLATTAFQTVAGLGVSDPHVKPLHIDRCHALRADGQVVAKFYPRWKTAPEDGA
jgi:Protein of unknown function (DUF2889)